MIARLNRVLGEVSGARDQLFPDRPRVNYYRVRYETDLFPGASSLDPVDNDQEEEIILIVQHLINPAEEKRTEIAHVKALQDMILQHIKFSE